MVPSHPSEPGLEFSHAVFPVAFDKVGLSKVVNNIFDLKTTKDECEIHLPDFIGSNLTDRDLQSLKNMIFNKLFIFTRDHTLLGPIETQIFLLILLLVLKPVVVDDILEQTHRSQ